MSRKDISEKYLVVEQKGWRVIALGLAIASILSLTFKAVFSPRRIQYEIERVLNAADARLKTSVEGAHLSLADGFWPRLAIVIDKLQIHTQDPCLFQAQAQIQNLELPMDFSSLIQRHLIFKRLEVGSLSLTMKAKRDNCGESALDAMAAIPKTLEVDTVTTPPVEVGKGPGGSPIQTMEKNLEKNLESPPLVQTMSMESSLLRHIIFHEVQLQLVEWPLFQWTLKKVNVHLPTKGEKKTHLEGVVALASDPTRFPFQGINAQLKVDADSDLVSAQIQGAWREGRIDVGGEWSPHRQGFQWKGSFRQIPWGQLMILGQVLGEKNAPLVSSQAWVSADLRGVHASEAPDQVHLENARVEGEFGDFTFSKIQIHRTPDLASWKVSPYHIIIKRANLDHLTNMLGWEEGFAGFERLGFFDGEAQFRDNQMISLGGQWQGLEIIFSNRGRRELQLVNKIGLSLSGSDQQWSGTLKDIVLDEGQWGGEVEMGLNQATETVNVETQFHDVKLSPRVQELMTMKGHLSPLEGKIALELVKGRTSHLKGFVKVEQALVNEFSIEKMRVDLEGYGVNVNGKIQIQSLSCPRSRLEYWPQKLSEDFESLKIKNLNGNFLQNPQSFALKDWQGTLVDLKSRFQFEAMALTAEKTLQGRLLIRHDQTHKVQNYQLTGTRSTPVWQ